MVSLVITVGYGELGHPVLARYSMNSVYNSMHCIVSSIAKNIYTGDWGTLKCRRGGDGARKGGIWVNPQIRGDTQISVFSEPRNLGSHHYWQLSYHLQLFEKCHLPCDLVLRSRAEHMTPPAHISHRFTSVCIPLLVQINPLIQAILRGCPRYPPVSRSLPSVLFYQYIMNNCLPV
jgi:hypothetical protein